MYSNEVRVGTFSSAGYDCLLHSSWIGMWSITVLGFHCFTTRAKGTVKCYFPSEIIASNAKWNKNREALCTGLKIEAMDGRSRANRNVSDETQRFVRLEAIHSFDFHLHATCPEEFEKQLLLNQVSFLRSWKIIRFSQKISHLITIVCDITPNC